MSIIKLKPGEVVLVSAGDPNRPDQGLPIPPDLGLGIPAHPIVLPPDPTQPLPPRPDQGLPPTGTKPPGGATPPKPTHPIYLPVTPEHPIVLPPDGELPPPIDPGTNPKWQLHVAWTPVTGWIVVAVPTGPHPTPSTGQATPRR